MAEMFEEHAASADGKTKKSRRMAEWKYSSTALYFSTRSEWSASRPGRLTPVKEASRYPLDTMLE
jgi:hypothetical protein